MMDTATINVYITTPIFFCEISLVSGVGVPIVGTDSEQSFKYDRFFLVHCPSKVFRPICQ